MPGNPKECREHAKRCLQLADETTSPALKDSLTEIAGQWTRLATDLETTRQLLDEFGLPQPQAQCIDANGFSLSELPMPAPPEERKTAEGKVR
jgi:hypothetical protein